MAVRTPRSNLLALVSIFLCLLVYYVTIWRPAGRPADLVDIVPTIVVSDGVADLYGASWRMREIDVPKSDQDETGRTAINGRLVAFLFEREFHDGSGGELSEKNSKCLGSVFDGRMREWSRKDLELPRSVSNWMYENDYSESCSGKKPARNYVLITAIPEGVHPKGVDVSFGESGKLKSIARFMLS
jgi:hypothetical protein